MARRVALARAFAITPDLLLLDDPLCRSTRQPRTGYAAARPPGDVAALTVLFVTHELGEAVALADRVLVLSPVPGRIVAEMPIPVPREQRHDGGTLAALQAELARLAGIHPGRSSLRIPSS